MALKYNVIFQALNYNKTNKALSEAKKSQEAINNISKDFTNTQKKVQDALEKTNTEMKNIKANKQIISQVNTQFEKVGVNFDKISESMALFDRRTDGLSAAFEIFSAQLNHSLNSGRGSIASLGDAFNSTFIAMRTGAISLRGVMALAFPFAAIIAGLFTLKKMWEINFLGMNTGFSKVIGDIKTLWGKFNVAFIKTLKAIEPLLMPVKFAFQVIGGVIKVVTVTLGTLFDTIGSVAAAFKEGFGDNNGLESSANMLNIMGIGLQQIAKVIGKIGKIASFVLVPVFKTIGTIVRTIFDVLMMTFDGIKKIISLVPDALLPESMEKMKNSIISEDSKKTMSGTTNNSQSITNNNGNRTVVVNTSKAADPQSAASFADMLAIQLSRG